MKVISEKLNRIASEICDDYCKYPGQYTKEEWEQMLEDDELPCNTCPLVDLLS